MNSTKRFQKRKDPNPALKANILSKIFFIWTRHVFKLGLSNQLNTDGLYENLPNLDSKKLTSSFLKRWNIETQRKNPSLCRALFVTFGWRILPVSVAYSILKISVDVLQPLFLACLISYFANIEPFIITKRMAYFNATGFVLCSAMIAFCYNAYMFYNSIMGVKLRLSCAGLVYRKCLQFSTAADNCGVSAVAISVLSKDLPQFDMALVQIHNLWKGPIEIFIFSYILKEQIGWPALVGVAVIVAFLPIQIWAGKAVWHYRKESAKRGDNRGKLMNEIISAMQVIKMYAWENYFAKNIADIRKSEVKYIRGAMKINAAMLCNTMISKLALTVSLLTYVYTGEIVTASKIFMATSYYVALNEGLLLYWTLSITTWAETIVCLRRVNKFLLNENENPAKKSAADSEETKGKPQTKTNEKCEESGERNNPKRIQRIDAREKSLELRRVSGSWDKKIDSKPFTANIKDISLSIGERQFVGIIGHVAAGKTTLLNAILGELELTQGVLEVNGVISFAPQDPWVFAGTLRENIVFVEDYDEQRYKEVLYACELGRDIETMPFGDSTIIGERGISLSGGQRARISLARAVYRKADIYLFDDPLSAVDSYVGKRLMDNCFMKFLEGKIRILVTHQVQHMQHVSHLVFMEGGAIKKQGSYDEIGDLIHKQLDEAAATGVADLMQHEFRRTKSFQNVKIVLDEDAEKSQDDSVDRKEGQKLGSVKFYIYQAYFKALRMAWFVIGVLALFVLARASHAFMDYFVSKWANHEDHLIRALEITPDDDVARRKTLMMIIILVLGTLTLYLLRTFGFYFMCQKISLRLHDMLFNGVIRSFMSFFDANPSGRIMNRFTNDLWKADVTLPQTMLESFSFFADITAVLLIVGWTNYWLLIPASIVLAILFCFRKLYIRSGRNLRRIECITCSPVYSHVNQTFQGLTTIRALNAAGQLESEFHSLQNNNTSASYLSIATNRAFALWIDVICTFYIFLVTFSFLVLGGSFNSGEVGLAISQSAMLLIMCQWGIRQTADLENYMTSVERIMEYADIPSEPAFKTSKDIALDPRWPNEGRIEFKNLRMRYNDTTPYTLKWLNFSIDPKEKIGIVGRTGAGKSSIIQAIFRLAINEGSIEIDGQDIAVLGLHDLRRRISIIPQEPVLFTGTLRHNLDPFGEKSDEELWRALDDVELKHHVAKSEGGLDCKVSDCGANFSTGQRQLVCLARAILRCNKILIMDEATANVDPHTDKLIQDTIQANFSECTVLTIAHRLHTIMENDKVLVIDAGRVVEMDHPHTLLQNPDGHLYKLVQKTGKTTAEQLISMAKESFEKTKL